MKGDFTRDTFLAANHFSRVLLQQGRVQLDSDLNEQIAILLHYLQGLAADLIGMHGGPLNNCAFQVLTKADIGKLPDEVKKSLSVEGSTQDYDLLIGRGHYYVDGILCEVDT